MTELCLPTADLRDDLLARLPGSTLVAQAVLADSAGGELAEVRFWVPGFLSSQPEGIAGMLAAMPALEVIQTQSAGVDAFVPLLPAGVRLCNASGVHGSSTSEWALAAMLAMLRDFPRFEQARRDGHWDGEGGSDELAGKRVVIVGAGDVGRALARRVLACEAAPVLVARTAREDVHAIHELPELLPTADVVALLVPKTSQTTGLVDAEFLAGMRDGALLVNGARGPVVRTDALLAELTSGRLRAALDVTDPEPLPAGHPLWQAPNLLLTPHVAGTVPGLRRRVAELIADQLDRFTTGRTLRNVISDEN